MGRISKSHCQTNSEYGLKGVDECSLGACICSLTFIVKYIFMLHDAVVVVKVTTVIVNPVSRKVVTLSRYLIY